MRVARLEEQLKAIQSHVSDIRTGVQSLQTSMSGLVADRHFRKGVASTVTRLVSIAGGGGAIGSLITWLMHK